MRAEQARDSGAKFAVQEWSGCLVRFKGKDSELCEVWSGHDLRGCHVFELTGDDWQPLVTKHERICAAGLLGFEAGQEDAERDAAAKIAELEAQVAQERQWRVGAQELADKLKKEAAELRSEVEAVNLLLRRHHYSQGEINQAVAAIEAEESRDEKIADLTAKLAAVEDGSAFVGEEWFPVGSSVGQLSWVVYDGAACKDDKMKLLQVRTENLAVAANRYFRYTGPKWAAPLPEPEPPAPEKPKIGAYVLATKYGDGDPCDHFCVGFLAGYTHNGRALVEDSEKVNQRANGFRRVEEITEEEGRTLFARFEEIGNRPGKSLWQHLEEIRSEPEPPTKPKCLEGVPAVLCRDEEGKEWWCHGTVSNGQVLMFRWYGGKSSWTAGFVAELTPIHHAPDAAGLAEEIRGESHGKPAPVNRK